MRRKPSKPISEFQLHDSDYSRYENKSDLAVDFALASPGEILEELDRLRALLKEPAAQEQLGTSDPVEFLLREFEGRASHTLKGLGLEPDLEKLEFEDIELLPGDAQLSIEILQAARAVRLARDYEDSQALFFATFRLCFLAVRLGLFEAAMHGIRKLTHVRDRKGINPVSEGMQRALTAILPKIKAKPSAIECWEFFERHYSKDTLRLGGDGVYFEAGAAPRLAYNFGENEGSMGFSTFEKHHARPFLKNLKKKVR